MTQGLRPYPKYKDSGVPWLGKVPEHWEVQKLRHILRQKTERNRPELPLLSVVREKGVILRDINDRDVNRNYIPDDLSNYKVVRAGQFAMNKMKAWQGSYGGSSFDGIVSPAYFVFDLVGVDGRYFHIAIRSKAYIPFFAQASDGVRIGQWDLSQARMREVPFFIPPLLEQTAIVRFLELMDRRIRRVIRARQRRIKLLEEYKQVLINQAVTGRIDVRTGKPYPKYKNSGVEWLGNVPEHWEVRRLRQVALMLVSNVDKHTKEGEIAVHLCNYLDVYKNERITADIKFMRATASPDEIKRFRLRCGDVAITKDSEIWNDIGVPALVEYEAPDLVYGYHLAILRPYRNQLVGLYLLRVLQSQGVATQLHVAANGVTRFGLSHNAIKNAQIPVPPLYEQTAIVEFLDEQTEKIDAAIAVDRRVIDLLKDFRTRLVADVVTGKLDVREAAASLPNEPNELEPDNEIDATEFDENVDTFGSETPETV